MSDDVYRQLVGLDEGSEDEHEEELRTILFALKNRKLDDYTAGVLNSRAMALLGARVRGRRVTTEEVAKATGQSRRTFYRRMQVARDLAPEEMADVRRELTSRNLTAQQAAEIVKLRRGGFRVAASAQALATAAGVNRTKRLSAAEQARLEGFVEGARWAHRALLQELPTDDWLAALTHDWRESKR